MKKERNCGCGNQGYPMYNPMPIQMPGAFMPPTMMPNTPQNDFSIYEQQLASIQQQVNRLEDRVNRLENTPTTYNTKYTDSNYYML